MPRHYCCANTCKSTNFKGTETNIRFIKFPQDSELRERWREVIGRGPEFSISQNTRICSKHFRSGKRSLNPASEDYVPSVFDSDSDYTKKSYCRTCHKQRCRCGVRARQGLQQEGILEEGEVSMADRMEDDDESGPDDGELDDADDQEWSPEEVVVPTRRGRGRPIKKESSSSSSSSTPAKIKTPARMPPAKVPTPVASSPLNKNSSDAKLLQRMKDMEEDHSRKLEIMSRNHNMTVANLKEEFQQKLHAIKVEWEDEKTKLWSQIEFLKEALNQRAHLTF